MKNVLLFLFALSAFYVGSVYTWTKLPPTAGPLLAHIIRNEANAQRGWPEAGQTYPITDNRNGKTYNISVVSVASSYTVPSGYTQSGLTCTDGSPLASCTAGVTATFTHSGSRVTYTTPSHSSRQAQYDETRTVQPATIVGPTRGSWIHQNEAMAIIGDTAGGPAGQETTVDVTPLKDGDYIIDFITTFSNGSVGINSVVVGAGSFI